MLRSRYDELSEIRRLRLQQLLQLRSCEAYTKQAIDWIHELCDVISRDSVLGYTVPELINLITENRKLESTANVSYLHLH